jgi:hypothetical protein
MKSQCQHQPTSRGKEWKCRVLTFLSTLILYFNLGAFVLGFSNVMCTAPDTVVPASNVPVQLAQPRLASRRVKNDWIVPLCDLRSNVLLVREAKYHVV